MREKIVHARPSDKRVKPTFQGSVFRHGLPLSATAEREFSASEEKGAPRRLTSGLSAFWYALVPGCRQPRVLGIAEFDRDHYVFRSGRSHANDNAGEVLVGLARRHTVGRPHAERSVTDAALNLDRGHDLLSLRVRPDGGEAR